MTARPPDRLFRLVLESHDGRAPGADSEEKHEPVSDIDTVVVDSLKALDPEWPIREADLPQRCEAFCPRGQHLADFGRWNVAEYIPIKMHHAALPARFGQVLGGALHQTAAGIRNDQLHALENRGRPSDAETPTSRTCPPWRPRRCLESPENPQN